jgi:hypothetical protein
MLAVPVMELVTVSVTVKGNDRSRQDPQKVKTLMRPASPGGS